MNKRIALEGAARIEWSKKRVKAAQRVWYAVKTGQLKNLKTSIVKCVDCGSRAECYDHRDYSKPLDVVPVCRSCNVVRGTNAPIKKTDKKRPFCPQCKSLQVLTNKSGIRRCRICGKEWKAK